MSNDSSCTYQTYDLSTLEPIGIESETRLKELDFLRDLVVDQQVLDIGTNSGIVAIQAAKWGAKKILATDVNKQLIDNLQTTVEAHGLAISANICAFKSLDPLIHKSDIVLCLEVIHWLVHQGNPISEIVEKLDSLTNKTLIIETPWDKSEKSIQARMNSSLEHYSLPEILDSFLQIGYKIQILYFATYFTDQSTRVMIRLDKK
jgi:2-polyprenyl-3-methyl-5-hydroxy-6-metoxy-1,4-benzoquinol methylase